MSPAPFVYRLFALSIIACSGDPVIPGVDPEDPPPAEIALVDGDGADGVISVFPGTVHQTIDGFGTSMRLFNDPHLNGQPHSSTEGGILMTAAQRDTIYDLLYHPTRGIGLNRLRLAPIEPGWQTSQGGPLVTDAPFPGPQGSAMLEFASQALKRNPELRTGIQTSRFDTWITKATPPRAVAEYIKTALDFAKARGHEPDWIGVHNEPSLGPPHFPPETIRDILKELHALVKADGRYKTMASAPDDVSDGLGARVSRVILEDPAARAFLSSLSVHLYGDITPNEMAALAAQYGLPLWMTEYNARSGTPNIGWAATIVHEMLVTWNCSAVDILFGFLGSPSPESANVSYITLNSEGTAYRGYTLNKSYFQMGQWSRYVTRGSVRIGASSSNPDVKVSAFMKSGKKVIVLINDVSNSTLSVAIPPGNYRVIRTQLAGTDRLTDKGLFKSAVRLPVESITTLVER